VEADMNQDNMKNYRDLMAQLTFTRWVHQGLESKEEDELLEKMDNVWCQLTPDEQDILQAEKPKTLIRKTIL
jgi:hypothetical protein